MGNRSFNAHNATEIFSHEEEKSEHPVPVHTVTCTHRFDDGELRYLMRTYATCFKENKLRRGGLRRLNKIVIDQTGDKHFIHLLLNSYKSNKNRGIDENTFIHEMDIALKGEPVDRLKLLFRIFDADSNGTIERKELLDVVKSFFFEHLSDEDVQDITNELIEVMDVDGDQRVSEDEFIKACVDNSQIAHIVRVHENVHLNMP